MTRRLSPGSLRGELVLPLGRGLSNALGPLSGCGLRRLLLASAFLLPLLLAACGGSGSDPATATPVATVTLVPTATSSPGYDFLYREFGRERDIIWRVDPAAPGQREQAAVIPHRTGWGIVPSLSPGGRQLAYTSFPEGALDPASQSEVYLLDLESDTRELIAEGVDLRLPPVWSPDGSLLFLRRITGTEVMILQVELTGSENSPDRIRITLQADLTDVLTFVPVGFTADERSIYLAQVQGGAGGGIVLGLYALGGTPPVSPASRAIPVVRLSEDGIARGYALSPDSGRLVFLVQELIEGRLLFRASVADLGGGSVAPLPTDSLGDGDHLHPLWHPDGSRIALGQPSSAGEAAAVALVAVDGGAPSFLAPPDSGFDVPLSWAPDGSYLALISRDSADPGKRLLVFVSASGERVAVAAGVDVLVVGWVRR